MTMLQELAFKSVLVLRQNTTLQEAARALCERQVGCALVADDKGHIIGIVTDRDLSCGALAKALSPNDSLSKVMSTSLIFVSEDSHLSEAVELMKGFGIRRLPVLRNLRGGRQKCVGLLTMDDLILSRAVSLEDLAEIVANQIVPAISFETKRFKAQTVDHSEVTV